MSDPAGAAARFAAERITVAVEGLPMTTVDRIESDLLADTGAEAPARSPFEWGVLDV